MPIKFIFFLSLLAFSCVPLSAQVIVNEVVTSNSVYFDEDGDSPDWLELHNTGAETADLTGFYLSDKPDQPRKWRISNLTLGAGEYAAVWASNKDRDSTSTFRTLVDRGDTFRYLVPSGPVTNNWIDNDFNDATWAEGASGFGYGDGDDDTELPGGTTAVFLRRTFTINAPAGVAELYFNIDFDDGFVAYLNGTEIARANMEGTRPGWDALATDFLEPRIVFGLAPVRYVVTAPSALLVSGENVLSIQGHNVGRASTDLTLIPFLTARFRGISQEGTTPPDVLGLPSGSNLHTNFKLSAAGETVYLNDPDGELVDSLSATGLPANHSVGIAGGGGLPRFFVETTPGARNPDDGFDGIVTDRVIFSHPGGPTDPLTVTLSGGSGDNIIRYTLDANKPDAFSPVFDQPITVDVNTVIRAAIFRPGYLPSPVATSTYLVESRHDLPVVSLVTEPDNFFHPVTGMYVLGEGYEGDFPFFGANIWEDTEHPVTFAFYASGGADRFQLNGGAKIFGGWSRGHGQRSFSIFARSRYGASEIEYPFFPSRDYDRFQAFVLRNSGNDNTRTKLLDAVLTSLMTGSAVDFQANQPAATYINGKYWGIYNLREKINEHFLASLHGVEADDIDLVELNGQAVHGSAEAYNALIEYIRDNPISQDSHYEYVADHIDLDNYVQYQAAQIYFDNKDWPGNNIKYWKHRQGKWRWILFDTDFGAGVSNPNAAEVNTLAFALNAFGPGYPNPPWSTLLFRRMITNQNFRHRFINQLADEMNSRFLPGTVIGHINQRAEVIASEMPRQGERWGQTGNWNGHLERMRDFFRRRPVQMKGFVREQFNLPAVHRLRISISDPQEGYVQVNSLTIEAASWGGDYFQDVPIRVTAIPREGYRFVRWELDATSTRAGLEIDMTSARTLRPVFTDRATSVSEPGSDLRSVTDLTVSPNPSDGRLRLSFTVRGTTELTATLHDALGREVRRFFGNTFGAGPQVQGFDVSALVAGAYFVHVSERGGGTAVIKWVRR